MLNFELSVSSQEEPLAFEFNDAPPAGRKIHVHAISVRQPWAWLLLHGKDIENRSRATNYRGPIYIHASKTFDWDGFAWLWDNMRDAALKVIDHFGIVPIEEPNFKATRGEFGGIIGAMELTDCVESSPSPWFMGPHGYVMSKPVEMPFYPCKGQLGIFKLEIEMKG